MSVNMQHGDLKDEEAKELEALATNLAETYRQ